MKTDCSTDRLNFGRLGRRRVVADFDGGDVTSDAGALLLREADLGSGLMSRFADCFTDFRNPDLIEHSVTDLVRQRVFAIALGYEDVNDHDTLRLDALLATAVGKTDPTGARRARAADQGSPLAARSTLNRLERTPANASAASRYRKIVYHGDAIDELLVDFFLDSARKPPEEIILDLDATDDRIHGNQEGRFYHGYYDHYCYLPLYIFCGDHLLCARLRPANIDGSAGSVEELERIVPRIRERWPETRIIIRADSGFARESIMQWCESNDVDYVLGLARNSRLTERLRATLERAKRRSEKSDQAERLFLDFYYSTLDTWSRKRRVIGKAEHLQGKSNPRFIVTSLNRRRARGQHLYETIYCARGDMENRIKEQQLDLFADRTSTQTMRGNQLRLYFTSIAYVLINVVRRLGLRGTHMDRAQAGTIRKTLFKIGAVVKVSVRRVAVHISSTCPYRPLIEICLKNLQTGASMAR